MEPDDTENDSIGLPVAKILGCKKFVFPLGADDFKPRSYSQAVD
jgi:hypothetical protein